MKRTLEFVSTHFADSLNKIQSISALATKKISENDDISYEIIVHNKRYEADFYQKNGAEGEIDLDAFNRPVWFMIDDSYGRYRILMFYDNALNQANGDDL